MKLTNQQVYDCASALATLGANHNLYIPAKANFLLQKNISTLTKTAEEIEQARLNVARHYGVLNEDKTQYILPEDKVAQAAQELNDLFNLEQEIDIKLIKLDDLGDAQFTPAQMQALMFMISEEE